jgi:hypothetical protein
MNPLLILLLSLSDTTRQVSDGVQFVEATQYSQVHFFFLQAGRANHGESL